jgi:predicted RNA-binding protein associated with RNAse of E/G family
LAFDEHRADYYRQLDLITRKLDSLLSIGGQMASTLAELNASLDDIKVGLAAHADKLAEIGLDLDDLIAKLGSGTTDQEALDAAVAKATEIKAAIQAESDQLDSLRSKHETA